MTGVTRRRILTRSSKRTTQIAKELRAMRRSITMLGGSVRRLAPILKAVVLTNGSLRGQARRRRPTLTPKQREALKLQGRYMGFIRQLKPRQKAEVRGIRERRGVL